MAKLDKSEIRKKMVSDVEPVWTQNYTEADIIKAVNWYNLNKTDKDAAKYLGVGVNIARNFMTLAWAKRMVSRGCVLNEKAAETMNRMQNELNEVVKMQAPVVDDDNVVSIQERVQSKVDYYIMELEGKFDDVFHRRSTEDFHPYTWMMENGVKPMHATKIAEHFRDRAREFVKIIQERKTDTYIKESYPRSHKDYCHAANILTMFMSDAEKLAANKNAAKKPRKKKPVSFEKRVKGIKCLSREDSLKIQSIDPVKILGVQQLWVYNVKTRKLGVYNATDASGLDVKGSAIIGFNANSISKTLRKPEKILKSVTESGKVALRKVMDDINSKPIKLNGRINKDTILLRVV